MLYKNILSCYYCSQQRAFMFPSVYNKDTSPGMSKSKSQVSASADHFVPKKEATLATSGKAQHSAKYASKLFPLKVETTCVSPLEAKKTDH